MYAKIFNQIFDSSIAEDYFVRHMFMDLLVLADVEGIVDMTLSAISRRTNVPIADVARAIAALCKPDPTSRSKGNAGARLELIDDTRDWGWKIINFETYHALKNEEERRTYMRNYMRKKRAGNSCKLELAQLTHPDVDVNPHVDVNVKHPPVPRTGDVKVVAPLDSTEFRRKWDNLPAPFPKIKGWSPKRQQALKCRLADPYWKANYDAAMVKMASIPFYKGSGERGWVADVDFFLRPGSVLKIMEREDTRARRRPTEPEALTKDEMELLDRYQGIPT